MRLVILVSILILNFFIPKPIRDRLAKIQLSPKDIQETLIIGIFTPAMMLVCAGLGYFILTVLSLLH